MTAWQRNAVTLCVFTGVSILFSWPLVTGMGSLHVSRQFDMYTLLWMVGAVSTPEAAWVYPGTAWPVGEALNRMDSFVLASSAWTFGRWVDAWWFPAIWALLGPVGSAWAAERVAANSFGARWPWSIIAGVGYGFTGLAATALLEGHVYALFNPWLPLLLASWMRAMGPEGTSKDGVWSGVFWVLCLLTSAYTGIAAALIVVMVSLGAFLEGRRPLKILGSAAAVVVPVSLWYINLFMTYGASSRSPASLIQSNPIKVMDAGALHLDTLAGWNGTLDLLKHSVTGSLGFTLIALVLFAPFVIRAERGMRTLFALSIVGLVLAFGPQLQLHDDDLNLPWVLYGLSLLGDKASFFNFPSRLLWVSVVAMSMVAARMATVLADHRGVRWAAPLMLFVVVDALAVTGAPFRTQAVPRATPSIYSKAPEGRAVLDLFPTFGTFKADMELFTNNLTCAYQVDHGRSIANQCLGTTLGVGPRAVLGKWMGDGLMNDDRHEALVAHMGEMGFGAIVLHPDTFSKGARLRVQAGLEAAFGAPKATGTDGGEYLVMYEVPAPSTIPDAATRRARYDEIEAKYQ